MDELRPPKRNTKGWLIRLGGTLVATVLFAWLLVKQDWTKIWAGMAGLQAWILLVVVTLYFFGILLNALRWRVLLRAQSVQVPFIELIKILITGKFASNFLPSTVGGDSVRVVGLLRFGATLGVSLASVVVDRLVNMAAMLSVLPFSFATFSMQWTIFQNGIFLHPAVPALAGVGISGGWVAKWRERIFEWIAKTRAVLQGWLDQPAVLVFSFVLSWLSSLSIFFAIWLLARALGISVALYQVMGIMALSYGITLLPISINGYGVREVTMATLFMQVGATLEQASSLAVITRFVLLLEALPGALWLSSLVRAKPQNIEEIV